jgi:hypothetical protein
MNLCARSNPDNSRQRSAEALGIDRFFEFQSPFRGGTASQSDTA